MVNYAGVLYGIIVSDNPNDVDPVWTFVALYSNAVAALQAIEIQRQLESKYAEKVYRSEDISDPRLFVESTRGHKIEFRMVTLTSSDYIPDVTTKLYATAVNGHIPITGTSFFATVKSLKEYDVTWQEGMDLHYRGYATFDPDHLGLRSYRHSVRNHYRIMEFAVKKEAEESV